jgi:sugar transferase (PEP-CTERM/EpsH1 system associated)
MTKSNIIESRCARKMDVLLLSHCVPNPPDKGEKIRAHHIVNALCKEHRVHVACFARNRDEVEAAQHLSDRCASVHAELLSPAALPAAAARFALGGCLNLAFYSSGRLRRYVNALARRTPMGAGVACTVVMAPYVPPGVPWVLDMADVDSEKWLDYAANRRPRFAYRLEARRLRREEIRWGKAASRTFLTTRNEADLFRSFAPGVPAYDLENGVDFDYFAPARCPDVPDLARRRYLVFTGTMDYWPNIDAAQWFATRALPVLRRRIPDLEFLIAGRSPAKSVLALAELPGVVATGAVPDIRPYLKHARAVVTPLRIARGIQNKVLEALAMGKTVLASGAVCRTFGAAVPAGVVACDSEESYESRICGESLPFESAEIRNSAMERFDWSRNMQVLMEAVRESAGWKPPA